MDQAGVRVITTQSLLAFHTLDHFGDACVRSPLLMQDNRSFKHSVGRGTSPQVIVNSFAEWYRKLGFVGCSSHSGRRSFITQAARKASLVGGSLRDVQALAGHASLSTTSRYIETDNEAQQKLVNIV